MRAGKEKIVNKESIYCTDCNGEVVVELKDCPKWKAEQRERQKE